jgi:hypothetical protein
MRDRCAGTVSPPARVERQLTAGKERLGGRRRDACRLRTVDSLTIVLGGPGTARKPISNRWRLPRGLAAYGCARRTARWWGGQVRGRYARRSGAPAEGHRGRCDHHRSGNPSRVAGWRNREVIDHLSMQPALLRRFIAAASTQHGRRRPSRPRRYWRRSPPGLLTSSGRPGSSRCRSGSMSRPVGGRAPAGWLEQPP